MSVTEEIRVSLVEIIRRVLRQPDFAPKDETSARDVGGWNSLNHAIILVDIEKKFSIRFDATEVVAINNFGELVRAVETKVRA